MARKKLFRPVVVRTRLLTQKTTVSGAAEVELDPELLGKPLADGIVQAIKNGIRHAGTASEATIAKRRKRGNTSTALWFETGRLHNSVKATWRPPASYDITVAEDRLERDKQLVFRIRRDIPVIGQPKVLLRDATVIAASAKLARLLFSNIDD